MRVLFFDALICGVIAVASAAASTDGSDPSRQDDDGKKLLMTAANNSSLTLLSQYYNKNLNPQQQQQQKQEQSAVAGNCNPPCQNGAHCVATAGPFFHNDDDEDDMHDPNWKCVCPDGYAGQSCERRRRTNVCSEGGEAPLFCKNGGECAEDHDEWVEDFEGHAVCDCSEAFDIRDTGLVHFVGRECEIEVLQEDYCAGQNRSHHKDLFCVQGGTCRGGAVDFKKLPCDCPPDQNGRHCEYNVEEVEDNCILTCSGNGVCQHGVNSRPDAGANRPITPGNPWESYMHCVCDDGWAGTNCEYEYVECETRSLYCYHGSTCKTVGDMEVCECTAGNGQNLAGEFCEYRATDDCNNNPPAPLLPIEHPENGMTVQDFPFCVNNGVCALDQDNGIFYCECVENYEGKRCEHKIAHNMQKPTPGTPATEPTVAPTTWTTETYYPTIQASYFPTQAGQPSAFPTSSSTMEQEQSADELEAGAVFIIVLIVLVTVVVLLCLICRYRRSQRAINRGGNISGDEGFKDGGNYHDNQEENDSPAYEMTSTTPSNPRQASTTTAPASTGNGSVASPDMADVELV